MLEFYIPHSDYKKVSKKLRDTIRQAEKNSGPISNEFLFEICLDVAASREGFSAAGSYECHMVGHKGDVMVGAGWNKTEYQVSWLEMERSVIVPSLVKGAPSEPYYAFIRTPYGVRVVETNVALSTNDEFELVLSQTVKLEILKELYFSFLNTPLALAKN